ncbi:MAG: hypothetical protein MUD01_28815 [Chloroflexaceae bacterium]|nr:hypothetical protein [Chloroflexaceae bacterium]
MTTPVRPTTSDDYDTPWKEILEGHLPEFLAFFFPNIHAEVDWARGYVFLDKELQQVTREAEGGRRLADKLVKVWRYDGTDTWVLIHIEVQGQEEVAFAERMYVYNYRLFDRYQRNVVSMALLTDERANWRPEEYSRVLWGCGVRFWYPIAKLSDYSAQQEALEQSMKPVCCCRASSSRGPGHPPRPTGAGTAQVSTRPTVVRTGLHPPANNRCLPLP